MRACHCGLCNTYWIITAVAQSFADQAKLRANEGTWESAWNRMVVEQSLIYGRLAKLCFHVRRDLLTEFLARIPFESFSGLILEQLST